MRTYFSPITGDGLTPETAIRPAISGLITGGFVTLDGRGGVWVHANATSDEHAAIIKVPDVQYLPLDDAAGAPVDWDKPLSSVAATNRKAATAVLEAHHVPLSGIELTDPVRRVIRRLHRRMLLRQFAAGFDLDDIGLATTLASIPAERRNVWASRLRERGVDLSDLRATSTLRDVLIAAGKLIGRTAAD